LLAAFINSPARGVEDRGDMDRDMSRLAEMFPADLTMTPSARLWHDPSGTATGGGEEPLDLTIFISCYNEADFIVATIETVREALGNFGDLRYEIIIVDDCSRDRSSEVIRDYIASHPQERILLRTNKKNRGLAQNYLDVAFVGKGRHYRLICGDNAEPKETMIAVFRELGTADMIIPYYVTSEGKSLYRRLLSNAYASLINLISGFRLHYYNGLAVHLRYNVMRWHPNTRGFGFQADIICMLLDQGFTYKEVPVMTIERRSSGSNALTLRNQLSVAHTLIDLIFRRLSNLVYRR
jgi:glycosyltransferase involved in cell wall biosynthesis